MNAPEPSVPLFPDLPEQIAAAAAPFLESAQPGDSVEFGLRVSTVVTASPRYILAAVERTEASDRAPLKIESANQLACSAREALRALDIAGLCRELLRRGWPRGHRCVVRIPGGEFSLVQSKVVLQ